MNESNKVELLFKDLNLKCEGYSMNDVISLIKALEGNYTNVEKSVERQTRDVDVEEVNLKELGKTVRMPKTTNNFRCPNCGQALFTFCSQSSEEGTLIVRDIMSDSISTYKVDVVSIPKIDDIENFISVYKDLLDLCKEKVVLVENSEDICSCPLCAEEKSISEWINAYNNPLDVFEISDICDVCGDEGTTVITQNGEYISCKNDCMSKLKK